MLVSGSNWATWLVGGWNLQQLGHTGFRKVEPESGSPGSLDCELRNLKKQITSSHLFLSHVCLHSLLVLQSGDSPLFASICSLPASHCSRDASLASAQPPDHPSLQSPSSSPVLVLLTQHELGAQLVSNPLSWVCWHHGHELGTLQSLQEWHWQGAGAGRAQGCPYMCIGDMSVCLDTAERTLSLLKDG